jgi:hypothetical protein
LSLWVYGRSACLRTLRRELEAAARRRRRKILFLDNATLRRLGREWEEPTTGADQRKRVTAERRALGTVGLVVLAVNPGELTGPVLLAAHQVIGARYGARKTTVILSSMDPASAYHFRGKGQDRDTMPWLVGRILEHGDAVEVTHEGAWCAEFVFRHRASDDYRIKILRERLGRVAIMRPRRDDGRADGSLDDESDGWKQGAE